MYCGVCAGNLSRNPFIMEPLVKDGITDVFLSLLNHPTNADIVNSAIGTLINLCSSSVSTDPTATGSTTSSSDTAAVVVTLLSKSKLKLLIEKFRKLSFRRLDTSILLCQLFYNLLPKKGKGAYYSDSDKDSESKQQSQQSLHDISHHQFNEAEIEFLHSTLVELVDCAEEYLSDKEVDLRRLEEEEEEHSRALLLRRNGISRTR